MGDWMILQEALFGELALPIWVDEKTGDFEVIGSREELKSPGPSRGWDKFRGQARRIAPWIDLVKIRNPKTGNRMSRHRRRRPIPGFDAGIVPVFEPLRYNTDRDYWKKVVPG